MEQVYTYRTRWSCSCIGTSRSFVPFFHLLDAMVVGEHISVLMVQIVLTGWGDFTVYGIWEWTCWGGKHFTAEWSTCWCTRWGKSWTFHIHSTDRAVKLKAMYVRTTRTSRTGYYIRSNLYIWTGQVDSSDDSIWLWTCWCSQYVITTWSKCTLTEQGEVVAVA